MQTISNGYRGLSILMSINWDRLFYLAVIFAALSGGALLGSLL